MKRLRKRDLYVFVNEYTVPEEYLSDFKAVTAEDISTSYESNSTSNTLPGGLKPEMIIVHNVKIDYSMKDKDPVSKVKFFQELTDDESFHIDYAKVSSLLPTNFLERKSECTRGFATTMWKMPSRKRFPTSKGRCTAVAKSKRRRREAGKREAIRSVTNARTSTSSSHWRLTPSGTHSSAHTDV